LIEFALIATIIAMLLSAAIDLGIAFKSYQMLINGAAEATSYLAFNPLVNCESGAYTCPDGTPASGADREALIGFRTEQSGVVRGVTTTMDLDDNGVDDLSEHSWGWIASQVRIQEADSTQVTAGNHDFAVGSTFDGTGDANCRARKRFDTSGGQCFIVVRVQMTYRPFVLKPILGDAMTIRAISVKPIVAGDQ
jgi:hypothetical protein